MPPSSSSPRRRRTTLFNKDGISLFATILPSTDNDDEDQVDDNDGASPPHQNHDGIILTLALNRQQSKNVINPTMILLLIQALDVIDTHPMLIHTNNKALIVTGLSLNDDDDDDCKHHVHDKQTQALNNKSTIAAKFFSNGLDLEWMLQAGNNNSSSSNNKRTDPTSQLIESFNSQILARLLILPFRTIAAINGHCIGAGLFLSLACDYRIMRTERGYIQWPEANLGMRLTKGFMELSKAKIGTASSTRRILNDNKEVSLDNRRKGGLVVVDHHVLREGILTAKRYTSTEALHAGIIDIECNFDELYNVSFDLAKKGLPESFNGMNLSYFDPRAYTEMKIELWTDAYRALKFGKVQDLPESRI